MGWFRQVEDGEAETPARLWPVSFVPVHGHGNISDLDHCGDGVRKTLDGSARFTSINGNKIKVNTIRVAS